MQIRNGFEEFFCLRSNLSNDNIVSAEIKGQVRKRVCRILHVT